MSSPAYLKAFKDFISQQPDFSHVGDMEREYYLGPDRPAVILQASNLEFIVENLIKTRFRKDMPADATARLFDANGPLSTFSQKILMGYALDLYGPIFRHDLGLIRDLRNGFAHVRRPLALTMPEVAAMCSNLKTPDMSPNWLPQAYSEFTDLDITTDGSHPRTRFTRACHTMSLMMLELGQFLLGLPEGVERALP